MGDTLKKLGFTVMVAENQNRQAFSQTLLAFDRAVDAGDTAFFFYAGHGFEIAGQNFLLPTDVPAATVGQEELVRDASIPADRIIERVQNRKVRTAILVFDACRNNPFERAGTRAFAGRGGLAPMTQSPEGVFSIFSAGPQQTALDRLLDDDANPNSVFTRTFAKALRSPARTSSQVAQRTRRLVSEMAETVRHKQMPVYFDQMVDDVFLNGIAKAASRGVPKPSRTAAKGRGLAAGDSATLAAGRFRQRADRDVLAPQWRLDRGVLDRRPDARHILAAGRRRRFPRDRLHGYARSADPQADAQPVGRTAGGCAGRLSSRSAMSTPTANLQGPFPIRFDPEAALIRDQRKILDMTATSWLSFREFNGLLVYYTHLDVVSLRDPRGARRHRQHGARQGAEDAAVRSPRPQRHTARSDAVFEARARRPGRSRWN